MLINSAAAATPFNLDPEIVFFSRIDGESVDHVFFRTPDREAGLPGCCNCRSVTIGRVDLAGRDPSPASAIDLGSDRRHREQHSALHWVETRPIFCTCTFETGATRSCRGPRQKIESLAERKRAHGRPSRPSPDMQCFVSRRHQLSHCPARRKVLVKVAS
jgi:hypothetical protein